MSESLTDAQLQDYAALAERLAAGRLAIPEGCYAGRFPTAFETAALSGWPEDAIRALLAEVAWLRAERFMTERDPGAVVDGRHRARRPADPAFGPVRKE